MKLDYSNSEMVDQYFIELFPGVVPTDEDLFFGRLSAYRVAEDRKNKADAEEKRRIRYEMATRMWTVDEMKDVAIEAGKIIGINEGFDFVIDEQNKRVFELLCLYFTNDKRFEEHGVGDMKYSLSKGIWLQSANPGTGKSVMLRAFYRNKRMCFGYKHTSELAVMFQKGGYDAIDRFIGTIQQPSSPINFYQNECGFMYDEMFGEDKVMHMGSPISISSYIINSLYDFGSGQKGNMWKFHVTSNVDGSDIEAIAGKKFRSRMPDMFNLIKLDGADRRIKKA